jgi:hypothetical protein
MGQMERMPASAYYWGALGSIAISALLMLAGPKNASIFIGLWPPTIALLGLFNKQLRPSQDVREAGNITGVNKDQVTSLGNEAAQTAQALGS